MYTCWRCWYYLFIFFGCWFSTQDTWTRWKLNMYHTRFKNFEAEKSRSLCTQSNVFICCCLWNGINFLLFLCIIFIYSYIYVECFKVEFFDVYKFLKSNGEVSMNGCCMLMLMNNKWVKLFASFSLHDVQILQCWMSMWIVVENSPDLSPNLRLKTIGKAELLMSQKLLMNFN
jgi:hypothetical protein